MFPRLFLLAFIGHVSGLALNICASTNLGSDHTSNEFMSNGYCRDYCANAGFTAAITQNYDCWCSDSVPANVVDISSCNIGCPGYSQQEKCGGNDVYGYIVFGSVSTVSSSASASTSVSSASSTSVSVSGSPTTSSATASTAFSTVAPTTLSPSPSLTSSIVASSTSVSTTTTSSTSTLSSSSSSSISSASPSPTELSTSSSSSTESSTSSETDISSSSTPPSSSSSSSSPSSSLDSHATTILSVVTINGTVTQQASTRYVTAVASTSAAEEPTPTSAPETSAKNSFFASTAKVAGTFTAVGVVAAALVATILYCCCFAAGGAHRDEYSDEENQYSSDGPSFAKTAAVAGQKSRSSSSHSNLKRSGSSKSILAMFTPGPTDGAGSPGVGRSLSRKKLNPKNEPAEGGGPIMAPISEFDDVLDPRAMFEEHNNSALSLNDENDYSRRIWHVTNPE